MFIKHGCMLMQTIVVCLGCTIAKLGHKLEDACALAKTTDSEILKPKPGLLLKTPPICLHTCMAILYIYTPYLSLIFGKCLHQVINIFLSFNYGLHIWLFIWQWRVHDDGTRLVIASRLPFQQDV